MGPNQSRNQSRKIVTFDKSSEISSRIADLQLSGCIERDGVYKRIEFRPRGLYLPAENVCTDRPIALNCWMSRCSFPASRPASSRRRRKSPSYRSSRRSRLRRAWRMCFHRNGHSLRHSAHACALPMCLPPSCAPTSIPPRQCHGGCDGGSGIDPSRKQHRRAKHRNRTEGVLRAMLLRAHHSKYVRALPKPQTPPFVSHRCALNSRACAPFAPNEVTTMTGHLRSATS